VERILRKHPDAAKAKEKYGNMPLHYALYYKASDNVIKSIFNANREATKVQNNNGMLPLHFALYREASNEIIKMIYIANCEATKVQNNDGWFPLHCALYRVASPAVIKMLFEAYPEAITVHGKHGELPIDLYRGDNSEIILMLLKAYCEAARKNDAIRDSLKNAIESGYWEAVGIAATLMSDDLYKAIKNKASCDEVKGVLVKYLEAATESNDVAFESAKELVQLVDTGDWEEVVLSASKFERNSPRSSEENLLPQRVSTFMPSHSGRISFDNTSRGTTGEDSVLPGDTQSSGSSKSHGSHPFGKNVDSVSSDSVHNDEDSGSSSPEKASSTGLSSVLTRATSSGTGISETKRAEILAEVEALVQRVVPDELNNLDEMIDQFKGREEELLRILRNIQERNITKRERAARSKNAKLEAKREVRQKASLNKTSGKRRVLKNFKTFFFHLDGRLMRDSRYNRVDLIFRGLCKFRETPIIL